MNGSDLVIVDNEDRDWRENSRYVDTVESVNLRVTILPNTKLLS